MRVTGPLDAGLQAILDAPWYRGQVRHVERQAATEARFAEPARPLAPSLAGHLDARRLRLYAHQAAAVDAWRAGLDVLLATRTSSGKSLAFNCCVAEELLADPDATALYLYPTKALAHDQLERLVELDRGTGLGARPAAYDGDTPASARARIRRESRIVVSNPYGLHEYLPQPEALRRFLGHLAVVVVDESHRYRGVFGANVALVLRRLARLAERLGASPRFVLASGTIANPEEHATALVGRPVTVVDGDGAAQGERTVALFDATADPERTMGAQAAAVVAELVRSGRTTICFAGSRVLAELVARWTSALAPEARISPYRAGYRPAERRAIEADLRSGALDAVICTNALELGIDIGGLDAAVLAGYPGTVASTWQQVGRAGRAGRPALAVLVAGDDPLDAYIVRRPATLFAAPVERAVVATGNLDVLAGQVLCAAAELPVRASETARFGADLPAVLDALGAEGLVAPVGGGGPDPGLGFVGTFRPASAVRLDGQADGSVTLRVGGDVLEVLDPWRAMRQAHPGAVFLHRGETYRVTSLDLQAGEASAEPAHARDHTRSLVARDHRAGPADRVRTAGPWSAAVGPAVVRSQVVGFRRYHGDELVGTEPLDLPVATLDTRALRLAPLAGPPGVGGGDGRAGVGGGPPGAGGGDDDAAGPDAQRAALAALLGPGVEPLAALHAAEHALIHALPLLAMCDRQDAGGLSTMADPGTGGPSFLLYDGYDGGSGIADAAFDHLPELAGLAADMLAGCDCDTGCPRCVFDRDCGSGNSDLDRRGALVVLRSVAAGAATS